MQTRITILKGRPNRAAISADMDSLREDAEAKGGNAVLLHAAEYDRPNGTTRWGAVILYRLPSFHDSLSRIYGDDTALNAWDG